MKKYAVIGNPIKHSLSPIMHSAAIKAMDIEAEYTAIQVDNTELANFAAKARTELDGFNITVPHKNAILPFLDEISEESRLSGSINTVSIKDGKLHGTSTDGYGLATGIKEAFGIDVTRERFCFIGCGGAARATAFYFATAKAKTINIINRTLAKAEKLASELNAAFPDLELNVCSNNNEKLIRKFFSSSSVTIQASSLGLKHDDPPPVQPALLLDSGTSYYDTIYHETALLKFARANGIAVADGRTMLLYQGVKSLSIWTGRDDIPVEAMRNALYRAIAERSTTS